MEERMNIAVVGDRDSIFCYAALGMDVFPAANERECREIISRLAGLRYAVIYITENYAEKLEAELARYRVDPIPAIIPIPGMIGNNGFGMRMVRRSVEKAIGSDIIFAGE